MNNPQKIHIIGVCGRTMAPMAKMFKDMGCQVSGSDMNFYPPNSTFLEDNNIEILNGYDAAHISSELDLVIVGGNAMHVMDPNPEVEQAKKLGIEVMSYPEAFNKYLEKPESIVVTGTYGKTTTCALLAWLMEEAGLNPSFDLGETPRNFPSGSRNTESSYSIIHGDEHPTLGYSNSPKFAFFQPKYLLHTAALWDHFNIYPTEESFVQVFCDLAKRLPEDGFLLTALNGKNNRTVIESSAAPIYTYDVDDPKANFYARDISYQVGGVHFIFVDSVHDQEVEIYVTMLGRANLENTIAALAMGSLLSISVPAMQKAMQSFAGLQRHLEHRGKVHHNDIFLDQGQLPGKAKGAIEALKQHHPERQLVVVFDPHASVLHDPESLNWYDHCFDEADLVMVGQLKMRKLKEGQDKNDRVTGKKITEAIQKTQPLVSYHPDDQQIVSFLSNNIDPHAIILFLSTGNFRGLIDKAIHGIATSRGTVAQ